jgi:putative membrane protein
MNDHSDMPGMTMGPWWVFPLLAMLVITGGCYLAGVQRLHSRGDRWPTRRSLAAAGGLICLAAAVLPAPGTMPSFPAHVVQHLLLAMLGPLLLALSALVTLALRTLPRAGRRLMLGALHSPVARILALAPVVLIMQLGGMYAYYLTPLYVAAHQQLWLQGLVHLHMFLAGCLLSWYLIGPDPMPRPSISTALIVLLIAAAAHDVLAKLLYAHQLPASAGTVEQRQLGAQIMFHGGTIIEILLATIVMATWYRRGGRALRHHQRRSHPNPRATPPVAAPSPAATS